LLDSLLQEISLLHPDWFAQKAAAAVYSARKYLLFCTQQCTMDNEKFCLRWNDFERNISSAFKELRNDKDFF